MHLRITCFSEWSIFCFYSVDVCDVHEFYKEQQMEIVLNSLSEVMCLNCKCTILSSSIKDYRSHKDENSKQVLER